MNDLNIPASETMMIGDTFEKDVQIPNGLGMFGVWFNPKSEEMRHQDLHITVHSMKELLEFFRSLDISKR